MIELHQYPAIWGLPSLSPFCIKVETFLKKANLPYQVVVERNPARGPKGKMPFIRDGERVVADSTFICDYLIQTYARQDLEPEAGLSRAQAHAFQRMIEENLYFVLLYSRWVDPVGWQVVSEAFTPLFPPLIGPLFLSLIRSRLKHQAQAQGIGRHSLDEVYRIGARDLEAISAFLADKPFLLGERWTSVDATLYAFLFTILQQPIESQLKKAVLARPNLLAYCERESWS